MPLDSSVRKELESLFLQLEQNSLTDTGKKRLEEILNESSDAIDFYLDHFEIEAMLQDTYGALNLPKTESSKECSAHQERFSWSLALALSLLLAFVGSWVWSVNQGSISNKQQILANNSSSKETLVNTKNIFVAKVTKIIGVELKEIRGASLNLDIGDSIKPREYLLEKGMLEIDYASGAKVILQSPVQFELVDQKKITVHQGRMSVQCPTVESKGFTVETPTSLAVDLGTEFSVEVGPSGSKEDEFHVFSGEVILNTKLDEVPVSLKKGQASRLDHKTSTPAGIDPDYQRFIRNLEDHNSEYRNEMSQLNPAIYYLMSPEIDGYTILNEMGDQAQATIRSSNQNQLWLGPGFDGGTSFYLDGARSGTYAVVKDYPKSTDDKLSVVAWVYAKSRVRWASIAKNWEHGLQPERRGQFHFGLNFDSGELEAHINDKDNNEQMVLDSVPLPLNRWHHVAMVADGKMLRLYRNGVEVDSVPYNGINGNPRIKPLAIGSKLGDDSLEPARLDSNFWDGYLDHVAVFNSALTSDQVENLYQVGHTSMREFRLVKE